MMVMYSIGAVHKWCHAGRGEGGEGFSFHDQAWQGGEGVGGSCGT